MEKEISDLIVRLNSKKAAEGCQAWNTLLEISNCSDRVYPYLNLFLEMMENDNSYVRTRGLTLIAANAKWDKDHIIDENLDEILSHILDAKPITARQFIQKTAQLAQAKPDLRQDILDALYRADTLRYPDSMRGLVEKDIRAAILEIKRTDNEKSSFAVMNLSKRFE